VHSRARPLSQAKNRREPALTTDKAGEQTGGTGGRAGGQAGRGAGGTGGQQVRSLTYRIVHSACKIVHSACMRSAPGPTSLLLCTALSV
jgi:hypothetical protein